MSGESRDRQCDVVADVFRFLRDDAVGRGYSSNAFESAVVTIPVSMPGPARAELRQAAAKAGIHIHQFVHEASCRPVWVPSLPSGLRQTDSRLGRKTGVGLRLGRLSAWRSPLGSRGSRTGRPMAHARTGGYRYSLGSCLSKLYSRRARHVNRTCDHSSSKALLLSPRSTASSRRKRKTLATTSTAGLVTPPTSIPRGEPKHPVSGQCPRTRRARVRSADPWRSFPTTVVPLPYHTTEGCGRPPSSRKFGTKSPDSGSGAMYATRLLVVPKSRPKDEPFRLLLDQRQRLLEALLNCVGPGRLPAKPEAPSGASA